MTKMATFKIPNENRIRCEILGIAVDVLSFESALSLITGFLGQNEPKIVVTADAAGIMIAQSNDEYRSVLQTADLVTPDSVGVLWAGKRFGANLTERVSGVELVDAVCKMSAYKGYRIFFLGSSPGIAEIAAEKMRLKHLGCNIVGTRHGFFPASDDQIVAQEIANTKPDVLFVAMGIPRQEIFISKTKDIIGAKVSMGVGGSLDVFSGAVKRAPKLFQKLNLEWLWRTLANPKKISKAKNLPVFFWRVLRSKR
jgi:N-acetylglucosaminyldiphosphoundecaprenol N-acetyl-beta-D-mannosaminyltransferase